MVDTTTPPATPQAPPTPNTDALFEQGRQNQSLPSTDDLFNRGQQAQSGGGGGFLSNVVRFGAEMNPFLPTKQSTALSSQPMSGPFADYVMNHTPMGQLAHAFGSGFMEGGGEHALDDVNKDPELNQKMAKLGLWNDYSKNQHDVLKSANEALMRPAIQGIYTGLSALGGLAGGVERAANQIGGPALSEPAEFFMETGGGDALLSGGPHAGALEAHNNLMDNLISARANGRIGESVPPTQEQLNARNQFVSQLPSNDNVDVNDVHKVVRFNQPDLFKEYDALRNEQLNLRDEITKTQSVPPVREIPQPNAEEGGTEPAAAAETSSSTGTEASGNATETKQDERLLELQSRFKDVNNRLRELSPDVQEAYEHGETNPLNFVDPLAGKDAARDDFMKALDDTPQADRELAQKAVSDWVERGGNNLPDEQTDKLIAERAKESSDPVVFEQAARKLIGVEQEHPGTIVPSRAGEPGYGPIAQDAAKQIAATGVQADKAKEYGSVVEAYYKTWANRFPGLGSAVDIYQKHFPEIQKGVTKGETGEGQVLRQDQAEPNGSPIFYSALSRAIGKIAQNKGPAEQWAGIIDNLTARGVKPEEIEWSGVKKWLADQTTKTVTKEDLQKYLDANRLDLQEVRGGEDGNQLKYSTYKLPGGKNYREYRITMPEDSQATETKSRVDDLQKQYEQLWSAITPYDNKIGRGEHLTDEENRIHVDLSKQMDSILEEQDRLSSSIKEFKHAHWPEPNVLAHIRFDEREGPNGEKVLHVAEVQSDWHQKGRKYGYAVSPEHLEELRKTEADTEKAFQDHKAEAEQLKQKYMAASEHFQDHQTTWDVNASNEVKQVWRQKQNDLQLDHSDAVNEYMEHGKTWPAKFKARNDAREAVRDAQKGVPDAPFKTSWPLLAMKRMLRYAVDNGFDKLSWDTGDTNGKRYPGSDARDEGMKGFYDEILPKFLDKYTKSWGGKVKDTTFEDGFKSTGEYDQKPWIESGNIPVHSLEITPEMKDAVSQGQPLFQPGKSKTPLGTLRLTPEGVKNVLSLFSKANASTFLHEMGHQWLEDLHRFGNRDDAPEDLKSDLATVRKWLGSKEGSSPTTAQHEKFARGVERYFMEGVAPSKQLAGIFAKFKDWLTQIYKTVTSLRTPISDDIRDVFDRLLSDDPKKTVVAPDTDLEGAREQAKQVAPDTPATQTPEVGEQKAKEGRPTGDASGVNPEKPNEEFPEGNGKFIHKTADGFKIDVNKISSEQDVHATIREIFDANKGFIEARRGKVTEKDISDFAEMAGLKASDVNLKALNDLALQSEVPLSAMVYGARQMMEQASKDVKAAIDTNDEIAYADARNRLTASMQTFLGIRAEWGRTGHAFTMAGEQAKQAQVLNQFLEDNVGKTLAQVRDEMKKGGRLKDPASLNKFIRKQSKPGWGAYTLEAYTNALLTGVYTHVQYWEATQAFALYRAVPERLMSALASKVIEFVKGVQGETLKPNEKIYASEALAGLSGITAGMFKGARAAKDAMWVGYSVSEQAEGLAREMANHEISIGVLDPKKLENRVQNLIDNPTRTMRAKLEPPQNLFLKSKAIASDDPGIKGTAINVAGSIVRVGGERIVAPLHTFNYVTGFHQHLESLIYRQALSEGRALNSQSFINRVADLRYDTPLDMVKEAKEEALSQTLMAPNESIGRGLAAVLNWEVNPLGLGAFRPLRFIQPFAGVKANILREAFIERTPIGAILNARTRDNLVGHNGPVAQADQWGKVLAGTAVGGIAGYLLLNKLMTPTAPADRNKAAAEKAVNGPPHSIRIGDMAYNMSRFGVIGDMLSMSADMTQIGQFASDQEYEKAAVAAVLSFGDIMVNDGPVSGLSDLLNAVEDPDKHGKNYLKNFALSAVPFSVFSSQTAKEIDPYQRQATDFIERFKAKIPGMSETLQPKIDIFGQPVPNEKFYGAYVDHLSNDPVWTTLENASYFPAPVKNNIKGVKLTEEEYHDYAVQSGLMLHMMLSKSFENDSFNNMPDAIKHGMVQDAVTTSREFASRIVLAQHHEIVMRINEAAAQKYQPKGSSEPQ